MAIYYVDDGGNNTNGSSWANAYHSLADLDDAVAIASGDIIYIGSDSVDAFAYGAARTFTGPASGSPAILISATVGTNTYAKATANHIDTAQAGAFNITISGAWAIYGARIKSGGTITLSLNSANSIIYGEDVNFLPAATSLVQGSSTADIKMIRPTIDLVQDSANTVNLALSPSALSEWLDLTIANGGFRTTSVVQFGGNNKFCSINGGDFTSCNNATTPALFASGSMRGRAQVSNIKTAATYIPTNAPSIFEGEISITNIGSGDAPTLLVYANKFGRIYSTTTRSRTAGATVNGTALSLGGPTNGIETTANCTLDSPIFSPWLYGEIAATGTYSFTVYITNDTADFNDNQVWLDVQYKDDASSGEWTQATDRIATRTTTPAAQAVDGTSAWNGTGPAFTFKQALVVSGLTVDTVGQFRARVGIGVDSIGAARHFYIDPKVTVV
jgi:hypothetical protein